MNTATQILAFLAIFCGAGAGGVYIGVWLERRRLVRQMDQYLATTNQKWKRARGAMPKGVQ